jgi:hypothetical protein
VPPSRNRGSASANPRTRRHTRYRRGGGGGRGRGRRGERVSVRRVSRGWTGEIEREMARKGGSDGAWIALDRIGVE